MSSTQALNTYLRTHAELAQAIQSSAPFRDFLEQAVKSSGIDPANVNPSTVIFRYTGIDGVAHESCQSQDFISVGQASMSIADFLAPQHLFDRRLLMHAVWFLEDFTALKGFLAALGGVVRYVALADGTVVGNLVLSHQILPFIESVERREYVLPNGDMASDAVTRAMGLRAKVFALDRSRRAPVTADESLIDRLTRTIARLR